VRKIAQVNPGKGEGGRGGTQAFHWNTLVCFHKYVKLYSYSVDYTTQVYLCNNSKTDDKEGNHNYYCYFQFSCFKLFAMALLFLFHGQQSGSSIGSYVLSGKTVADYHYYYQL